MSKRIAVGLSSVVVAVLAAGGLLGALVVGAGPANAAPGSLYAAPSAIGTGDCSSAADACTLETALSETTAGDTVYLVQGGTEGTESSYYIGNWDPSTSGTSAAAQVTIEPGPGVASAPILDGNGTSAGSCETTSCDGPVLTIAGGVYATLEGITIQHADNNATIHGGGIDNGSGATLTVSDSTFTDNVGFNGGAIDNADLDSGALTVSDSTFTGNDAFNGGAISSGPDGSGTLTVSDSTFTGNSASDNGGAIDNGDYPDGHGTLTVWDSTFTGNLAAADGGTIDSGDGSGSASTYVAADIFDGSCDPGERVVGRRRLQRRQRRQLRERRDR